MERLKNRFFRAVRMMFSKTAWKAWRVESENFPCMLARFLSSFDNKKLFKINQNAFLLAMHIASWHYLNLKFSSIRYLIFFSISKVETNLTIVRGKLPNFRSCAFPAFFANIIRVTRKILIFHSVPCLTHFKNNLHGRKREHYLSTIFELPVGDISALLVFWKK